MSGDVARSSQKLVSRAYVDRVFGDAYRLDGLPHHEDCAHAYESAGACGATAWISGRYLTARGSDKITAILNLNRAIARRSIDLFGEEAGEPVFELEVRGVRARVPPIEKQ